jgi:hypothetical protein
MFARTRTLLVTFAVLAASLSASAFGEFRDANAVMKCCAKTHYACAGVGTPENCCRKMHHSSSRVSPSIIQTSSFDHALAVVPPPVSPFFSTVACDPFRPASDWSRPHDPPHLHTFSLLI